MVWAIGVLVVCVGVLGLFCIHLSNEVVLLQSKVTKINALIVGNHKHTADVIEKMDKTLREMNQWVSSMSNAVEQEMDNCEKLQRDYRDLKSYYVNYVGRGGDKNG